MLEAILSHLERILNATDVLLLDTGLDDEQQFLVHRIFTTARVLRDLFLSLPAVEAGSLIRMVSFETRDRLSGIIGYAEIMLEEEQLLAVSQRRQVHEIRKMGTQLLTLIEQAE